MAGEKQKKSDIQASDAGSLQWRSDDVRGSLDRLLRYVEEEAAKSTAWYWVSKKSKAKWSQVIRMSALVLTAAGALVPVVFYIGKELGWVGAAAAASGLWA